MERILFSSFDVVIHRIGSHYQWDWQTHNIHTFAQLTVHSMNVCVHMWSEWKGQWMREGRRGQQLLAWMTSAAAVAPQPFHHRPRPLYASLPLKFRSRPMQLWMHTDNNYRKIKGYFRPAICKFMENWDWNCIVDTITEIQTCHFNDNKIYAVSIGRKSSYSLIDKTLHH